MGHHSGNCQQAQWRQLIRRLTLGLAFLVMAGVAHAGPHSVSAIEKRLTEDSVLVRTGLKPCVSDEVLENLAGAQLEQIYASETDYLVAKNFTKKIVDHIAKADCLKDCSCAVRSKIWEKIPESLKKGITADFEAVLAKMTDEDYGKCRAQLKNVCAKPDIKAFITQLKKAQ